MHALYQPKNYQSRYVASNSFFSIHVAVVLHSYLSLSQTFLVAYIKSAIIFSFALDLRDIIIQALAAFVCYPDSLAAMENMPEAL